MLGHLRDALCSVLGSNTHRMTAVAASVGSALLYGITSTSMAFLNKLVVDYYNFNFPLLIMTLQMVVTYLIVRGLHYLAHIQLAPLTKENMKKFAAPCFFYSLNGVFSLAALGSMNLTMYSMLKRNAPLCTLLLSIAVLKKSFPGKQVLTSVLMMSVGCIVAANGDITFDMEAYAFGAGSVLSQSLYLILLQSLSDEFSTNDTLYMNSIMSLPVLTLLTTVTGEVHQLYQYNRRTEMGFILSLTILLIMGSFLNYTQFLCNSNNTALTTSVVGTLKSVAQTTLGMFTFGGVEINTPMIAGVTLNLSGGIAYTYAKYQESQKKEIKKHTSSVSLDNGQPDTFDNIMHKDPSPLKTSDERIL